MTTTPRAQRFRSAGERGEWPGHHGNWGRWPDDRGSLNLIDATAVLRGFDRRWPKALAIGSGPVTGGAGS